MRLIAEFRVQAISIVGFLSCALSFSVLAANTTLPWSFVNGRGDGYSIRLVSASPPAGTTVAAGQTINFTLAVSYKLSIADKGEVVLVIQDENDVSLQPDHAPLRNPVVRGKGKLTITQSFKVPSGIREVRLFIPLVPEGMQQTDGELVLRYPISNEVKGSTIGYQSVAAALADLRSKSDVQFSEANGWTVVYDRSRYTVWSFSPKDDPSYPSAVKRSVVNADGGTNLKMDVLCESTQAACDKLVQDFNSLNDQARNSLKH